MSFTCRLIREDEFTPEFELFVMKTFFQDEPLNHYLKTQIPDDIDLPWFKQALRKAKDDHLSFAFYDEHSLPIAFAINHHDAIHDVAHSDTLYSPLNQRCSFNYEHISHLLTKLHENINLFEQFHCQNLFHIYLLGVTPAYRRNQLASQLVDASLALAKDKHLEMVYADATSNYSLNAFLKHGFRTIQTINYDSYENSQGEKIFQNIQVHKGCSIVIKDLREK